MPTVDDSKYLQYLAKVEEMAHGLVESIAWVNYLERKSDAFGMDVSKRIRTRQARDELWGIVQKMCTKTRNSPITLRTLNGWPDLAAMEIVAAAVKGWIIHETSAAGWLRDVRLIVKFEGVDQPYCQEAKPNLQTLMKEQVSGHRVHRQRSLGGVDEMLN